MTSARAQDPAVTVSVAPTSTTLLTLDTSATQTLTMQVTNTDALQTLACTVQRKAIGGMDWADTPLIALESIAPLTTAVADLDCGGSLEVRVVGTASGAGLDASVGARDKPRRP